MIMKPCVFGLLLFASFASANPLQSRTYTFKTGGNEFTCSQGVANNGHNYPVPTRIEFMTMYGAAGIYYPSKLPLNNTQTVELDDDAALPCSAYSDLLNAPGYSLNGTAVQKFSESLGKTADGDCFQDIREDLTITIGKYKFYGAAEFNLAMDESDCR